MVPIVCYLSYALPLGKNPASSSLASSSNFGNNKQREANTCKAGAVGPACFHNIAMQLELCSHDWDSESHPNLYPSFAKLPT